MAYSLLDLNNHTLYEDSYQAIPDDIIKLMNK